MTLEELINKGPNEVRHSPSLMELYVVFFKQTFGQLSACTACTFKSDFKRLVNFYKNKTHKMKPITQKITIKKSKGIILYYIKDGQTYRKYDNILDDQFIEDFLKNGTEEQLASRRKLFNFPEPVVEISKKEKIANIKKNIEELNLQISLLETETETTETEKNAIFETETETTETPSKKKK